PEHREYRAGGAFSDNSGGVIGVGAGALKIRRVDSTGQYAWDEVDLNQGQFAVIKYSSDGKGGIYVNWPGDGVSVQRISFDGNLVFDENHIKVCIGDDCHGSRGIVEDGESGAITIWSDTRHDTLHSFYAQHIDSNGAFLWDSLGIWFHSTEFTPLFSGSAIPLYSDGRGGAILLWDECCNGNRIYIKQISYNGNLGEVITGVDEDNEKATVNNYQLFQNYPNPFNPTTTINYSLFKSSFVTIKIYDVIGREIETLVSGEKSRGNYSLQLNGSTLPSGIYYYQIKADGFIKTKKMILVK
ncbi:MAG: T9SS type A sorting domain-containing protein, partial [Melioribacteraceae bacterium]|nr:T9SS type A sorting domain-containing protein [Melioribacteraceae bacterium]